MQITSIVALAVGLAMDAMAAAATRGLTVTRLRWRHVLLVGGLFGGFQALMPLIGYWIGDAIGPAFEAWDHWIAFALLGGIGAKMIHGAWRGDEAETVIGNGVDPFSLRILVPLALATSIDALAAGVTLPMLNAPFVLSLATIGIVTSGLSVAGLFLGRRFGVLIGSRLDGFGGVVLLGLAGKTLIEHLVAHG